MTGRTRRLIDSAAKWGITIGGVFVILCILGMMVFLGSQVVPLWKPPSTEKTETFTTRDPAANTAAFSDPVIAAANEYREVFFEVGEDTRFRVFAPSAESADTPSAESRREADHSPDRKNTGSAPTAVLHAEGFLVEPDSLGALIITSSAATDASASRWVLGTDRGSVVPVELADEVRFTAAGRRYEPEVRASDPVHLSGEPIRLLDAIPLDEAGGFVLTAWSGGDTLYVLRREAKKNLMGKVSFRDQHSTLILPASVTPRALALDYRAAHAFVGTARGSILEYTMEDPEAQPSSIEIFRDQGISTLGTLVGGHSLVIGGERGRVEVWFRARISDGSGAPRLTRGHTLDSHAARIMGVAGSNRDRTFVTWDEQGQAKLHYATSSSTRMSFELGTAQLVTLAPKGDGMVVGRPGGGLEAWELENPHPEAAAGALFTKVHYVGYPKPAHVWQSTGASDEFEPKLGLMPLIFGTLKGTFYALLVSVPIAVLAAIYTALFMHPKLRGIVKPTMEMMAALPSVVLGFLAGLWLAPVLQHSMPAAILAPLPLAVTILTFGWLWRKLPRSASARIWPGAETLVLIGVILATIGLWVGLNARLDGAFEGGFLQWLYTNFDVRYDQRNALVIGIAMGLAVIPIIFTISEDSLANVPRALKAASLALGATPWQTAWRVVLPAASPGIFAAIVIGLGRAVGETMIVLMATGNTPIMDWSPFNGLRTLAANIAVEIPEAPHEGSLYRVLFLTALILFAMTFVVNTVAEVVRHRLRQKYSRF